MIEKVEKLFSGIRLLVLDVDGVLTDGNLYFSEQGEVYKAFHAQDGWGIKTLLSTGVCVAVITLRKSLAMQKRMTELGVVHIYQVAKDKQVALADLVAKLGITLDAVAYVGDDLPDLPVMRKVGLGIAVSDAVAYVRQKADFVTNAKGGRGAVREVCEHIMRAQGALGPILARYL